MRRAEIVAAILLAFFSIYLMWKSAELPVGWIADEGPGGGAFPFWLSAIMLVCCLWTMVNWYRHLTPPSNSEETFMDAFALRMFILVGGALTVMIGLFILQGCMEAFRCFYCFISGFWVATLGSPRFWSHSLLLS